ncbi:MAG: hypothetical protein N2317_08780 [Syntrophales bacterium]|nr:hypothetical protein [Syntrophales bacterium]
MARKVPVLLPFAMRWEKLVNLINVVLPVTGICLIIYYKTCGTTCRYLKGEFLGFDLEMWGFLLMVALLALNPLRRTKVSTHANRISTVLISSALGGEAVLLHFQVTNDIYCPYCISFLSIILLLMVVNFRDMQKSLAFSAFVAGVVAFILFFHGSTLPLYG